MVRLDKPKGKPGERSEGIGILILRTFSESNNSQKNTDMCHSFQMGRLEILFETLKFLLLGLNLIHDGGLIEFYWIYSTLLVEIHVYMYSQFR